MQRILGSVARNLALTFGARGGVIIAGGIPHVADYVAAGRSLGDPDGFQGRTDSTLEFEQHLIVRAWTVRGIVL